MTYDDIEFFTWPLQLRGGQHVGVSSGVLAVHRESGLAVVVASERSQMKNREMAAMRLHALHSMYQEAKRATTEGM